MLARTWASQACGSMSFILALTTRLYISAALWPARSDPANSQDLRAEGNAAQAASGGVVREANASIIEEPGKHRPALQHVVHRFCNAVAARQLSAFGNHPAVQVGHQRLAKLLAHALAPVRTTSVDVTLDVEQSVDALNHLQAKRRYHGLALTLRLASRSRSNVGQHKELAARVRPTPCFQNDAGTSAGLVKLA